MFTPGHIGVVGWCQSDCEGAARKDVIPESVMESSEQHIWTSSHDGVRRASDDGSACRLGDAGKARRAGSGHGLRGALLVRARDDMGGAIHGTARIDCVLDGVPSTSL